VHQCGTVRAKNRRGRTWGGQATRGQREVSEEQCGRSQACRACRPLGTTVKGVEGSLTSYKGVGRNHVMDKEAEVTKSKDLLRSPSRSALRTS
jgi:hypothetical protein